MSDVGDRDDEGALSRWSRRKAAARLEQPEKPVAPDEVEAASAPEPEAAAAPELTEAETLEKLGLPDPDTLGEGDDFSGFMRAEAPEALRLRALRRLWRVNPTLANLDGLVDYGGDFTDAATVIEAMTTAYRVGSGFMTDDEIAEAEAAKEAAREASREAAAGTTADDEPVAEEAAADEVARGDATSDQASADGGSADRVERADPDNGRAAANDDKHEIELARVSDSLAVADRGASRRMKFRFDPA